MGLFNLFGGKKKDEARQGAKTTPSATAVKSGSSAKPAEKAKSAAAAGAAPVLAAAGAAQVKLRLKLAASLRTGQHAEAYAAAKGLADIQAKAGRRLGARMWAEQAERILAQDPKAA